MDGDGTIKYSGSAAYALCEPDAPAHDLVLRLGYANGAGVISVEQIVTDRHTGVGLCL